MKTQRQNVSGDLLTITGRNTRSKTSENGRDNALPIPTDLVFEIFSRLSVKSIAISRCVSKTWASVLHCQDFTELFLSKSRARPKLLFACQKGGDVFFFSAPQPQNPDENSSPVVATNDWKLSFNGDSGLLFEICVLDHGLVGLTRMWLVKGRQHSVPVICNPSTGQSSTLARVETTRVMARSLFGYDPIDKQVKVLSVSEATHGFASEGNEIMTLGTGKLLQRIINCGRVLHYYGRWKGRCINGVLYYKTFEKSTMTFVLVCVDVRSEKFSFIKVEKILFDGTMVNYNGKLGLLRSGGGLSRRNSLSKRSRSVNLCVLEDIEKQEWSEHTYVLPALWKNIVGSEVLRFVGMTGTNEIVMRSMSRLCLFYFNTEKNTVVRVEIQGIDLSEYARVHIFLDHVENVKLI